MARRGNIVSFDDVRRDGRGASRRNRSRADHRLDEESLDEWARRRVSPIESGSYSPAFYRDDYLPAQDTRYRRESRNRDDSRTRPALRASDAPRGASSRQHREEAGSFRRAGSRVSQQDRPTRDRSRRRREEQDIRDRLSSSRYRQNAPFEALEDEAPGPQDNRRSERDSRQPSIVDRLRRSRRSDKAERDFQKRYGGQDVPQGDGSGPRAAVYETRMGSRHRQASRMQGSTAEASTRQARRLPEIHPVAILKAVPRKAVIAVVAVAVVFGILYPSAQGLYHSMRKQQRLEAELALITERNAGMQSENERLKTDEGVEARAREEYGWVGQGEQAGSVQGLSGKDNGADYPDESGSTEAEAPATWYSPFLDVIFGPEQ